VKPWNSTLNAKREKPRRIAQDAPKGLGAGIFHPGPFRSSDMLMLASVAPHCMNCGVVNTGQVVGCHPNSLEMGKGMGIKAHDVPAYLCGECHSLLDGRAGTLTRFEKEVLYLRASNASMVWLLQSGHLRVSREAA